MQSKNVFTLSTFTTGDYVIPPLPAAFELPDSTRKVVLSEGIPIKVNSLLEEGGDSLDIRPTKPVYEFQRNYAKYYAWGGVALAFILVVAYLLWRRFRRREEEGAPEDLRPPWERAFESLALLKEKPLLVDGSYRDYYFELTEITRNYLGRMYQIDVMEMTTEEFLQRFQDVVLPGNLYEQLGQFFPHADLVKFAKYQPDRERAETDMTTAHDIVEQVRADFAKRIAPEEQGSRPQPTPPRQEVGA
jgi:hypothetical protein